MWVLTFTDDEYDDEYVYLNSINSYTMHISLDDVIIIIGPKFEKTQSRVAWKSRPGGNIFIILQFKVIKKNDTK